MLAPCSSEWFSCVFIYSDCACDIRHETFAFQLTSVQHAQAHPQIWGCVSKSCHRAIFLDSVCLFLHCDLSKIRCRATTIPNHKMISFSTDNNNYVNNPFSCTNCKLWVQLEHQCQLLQNIIHLFAVSEALWILPSHS